jgi:hypothetical protein
MSGSLDQNQSFVRAALRTPRAAAVSGIVFSLLLTAALVLIKLSTPADISSSGRWLTESDRRRAVALALNLIPFAGIAFLWFIGVIRDRIGQHEDRFFATVFLGSGLLFIATLFIAAALAGGIVQDATLRLHVGLEPTTVASGRQVTSLLLRVYAMRMAGVFTMSTATILLRTRIAPRWISVLGIVIAVVLLITLGLSAWLYLLFPAWIGLLSVYLLWRSFAESPGVRTTP